MNNLSDTLTNIDSYSKNKLDMLFNNNIIAPILGLLLVIYASLAAPKLPPNIGKLFDNTWFKLIFLFLISYSAWKNPLVSILASIGVLITIQLLTYNYTSMNTINNKSNNNQYDIMEDSIINQHDNKHNSEDTDIIDNTNAPTCNVPDFDVVSDTCNVAGYSEPTYASY